MLYRELPLSDFILNQLDKENITETTPIQEKAIPEILAGKDIIGLAQTGTGKTFAFLIPVVNRFIEDESIGDGIIKALVLAPTRELVSQIASEAKRLASSQKPLKVAEIIGGADFGKQLDAINSGVDLVVATPGRLLDFIKQNKIELKHIQAMILDEADRMLDMGFINDIKTIMVRTPKSRQTLMFSATMPYEIYFLASNHMRDPVEINISQDQITTDNIDQQLYHLGRDEKMPYLINMMLQLDTELVLIFTNMRVFVDDIVRTLMKYGIPARGMSSLLPQNKRTRLMSDYKSGKIKVLVATDVASRGIDVDGISHVFNYDMPQDSENYVHRIGRTARAGRKGTAISFCSEYDYEDLARIEKYLGEKIPTFDVDVEMTKMPKGDFQDLNPSRGQRERGERDRGERERSPRERGPKREKQPARSGRNESAAAKPERDKQPAARTHSDKQQRQQRHEVKGQRISHVGAGGVKKIAKPGIFARIASSLKGLFSRKKKQEKTYNKPEERKGNSRGRSNHKGHQNRNSQPRQNQEQSNRSEGGQGRKRQNNRGKGKAKPQDQRQSSSQGNRNRNGRGGGQQKRNQPRTFY